MNTKVDDVIAVIKNLNAAELLDLRDKLLKWTGGSLESLNAAPASSVGSSAQTTQAAGDKTYKVFISGSTAEKRITVLKAIKELMGWSLSEAKGMAEKAETAKTVLVEKIKLERCNEIIAKLKETGITVASEEE